MSTAEFSLSDRLNRRITYLRVSLTDRCNFRCGYCYDCGAKAGVGDRILDDEAILRLIRIFARLGVRKVRFTGGEPLLREGIVDIVRETSRLDGIDTVGITTNGYRLDNLLQPLIDAGLNRLNISLDTLQKEKFEKITGADGFNRVMSAIDNAEKCGAFDHVKINTVIMRGVNDSEIPAFVEWALPRKIDIRFIEYMPVDQSGRHGDLFMSESEIRERVGIPLRKALSDEENRGPAESYFHPDYPGRVSFISAVSRCFCDGCNRLRLTSQGEILGCLFQNESINLTDHFVGGRDDREIAAVICGAVNRPGFRREPGEVSVTDHKPFMRGIGG